MGEAKRRRDREKLLNVHSKPIKRARFNLLTTGTRLSTTAYMCEELSWWASQEENLLGLVARDTTDDDYLWMVLARDKIGRFRCASLDASIRTKQNAERQLRAEMAEVFISGKVAEFGEQGDETNSPLDPFEISDDLDRDKLHPYFKMLADEPGRAPARKVIKELALWLAPKDPHFVREFQTNGFDQRLWELFLWAAFREFFLDVEQLDAPDFRCTAPGIDFTVEATTVAPSQAGVLKDHPNPSNQEEMRAFLRDYMPMKFGGALTSKLNKKNAGGKSYWEREESKDKPFVIAIADFHKPSDEENPGPMTYTQSALWQYLYGSRVTWRFEDDQLIIDTHEIDEHEFNGKKVPSGFFDLPDAENVSAVVFSNAGTIAKFDRMGTAAGFGAEGFGYFRMGYKPNPDPNAIIGEPFHVDVCDPDYEEFWTQEIQVFHNPNAKFPLPTEALLGATHHFFEAGQFRSLTPEDAVLSSMTLLVKYVDGPDDVTESRKGNLDD
ncbi:hypothetical protein [Roseibium alexandrii]|uniref:Glycosaminoglycan attachment site n=1 Tax=Roseibium alexandrii TaxID=388408 RepID=A0A0M7AR22_9HYPH|nr:hypothetical protein [Roseibium alexandrii]CTQ77578.1 hypothetical protein LAX5112_04961 [Roseibium alexandrii]